MSFNETYHDRADMTHLVYCLLKYFVRSGPNLNRNVKSVSESPCILLLMHIMLIMQTVIYFYMQTQETNILGHCFQRVFDG